MSLFFRNKAKDFDKHLVKAQKQISQKRYKDALETLSKAESLLNGGLDGGLAGRDAGSSWAWIYDSRRYAQYELGQIEQALDTCRAAIDKLRNTTLFPYLSEDSHVRATLRAAHNTLAWTLCERAVSLEECKIALDHINACFSITSPIDDQSELQPFFETHAIVLLRLIELTGTAQSFDADPYRAQLFDLLTKMKKREHEALTNNAKLAEVCRSADFEAHFASDPEAKLKLAPPDETLEEAVARYRAALEYYEQIKPDYAEYFGMQDRKLLSEQQLVMHETSNGFRLPDQLRDFALNYGVFGIGTFETKLAILEHWDEEQIAKPGLVNFIDYCWGGRPEFEEFYKPQHIEHIDQNFFAFGVRYIDDNCHEYLFFDKEGNFGTIFMDQDCFGDFQADFNPLLKTNKIVSPTSFSGLFSRLISEVIEQLQSQINDE